MVSPVVTPGCSRPASVPHKGQPTRGLAGIFTRLGRLVVRWPWMVMSIWVALAADAPSSVTAREMKEAFGEAGSANVIILVLTVSSRRQG